MPNKSENNEIEPNHEIGLHGRRCSQHPQICIRSYPTHDNVECSKCEADRFFSRVLQVRDRIITILWCFLQKC